MKWINVKDGPPNKDMKVWVYCTGIEIHKWGFQRSKYITDEYWHNGDKIFCLYKHEWFNKRWFFKVTRYKTIITHWMKFPEVPTK